MTPDFLTSSNLCACIFILVFQETISLKNTFHQNWFWQKMRKKWWEMMMRKYEKKWREMVMRKNEILWWEMMMTQMSDWWFSGKEADRAAAVSNNWHMKRKWGNFSLIFSCIQHICKTFGFDIYDIWRERIRKQIQWKKSYKLPKNDDIFKVALMLKWK